MCVTLHCVPHCTVGSHTRVCVCVYVYLSIICFCVCVFHTLFCCQMVHSSALWNYSDNCDDMLHFDITFTVWALVQVGDTVVISISWLPEPLEGGVSCGEDWMPCVVWLLQIRVQFKWRDAFDEGSFLAGKRTLGKMKHAQSYDVIISTSPHAVFKAWGFAKPLPDPEQTSFPQLTLVTSTTCCFGRDPMILLAIKQESVGISDR